MAQMPDVLCVSHYIIFTNNILEDRVSHSTGTPTLEKPLSLLPCVQTR